MIGAGRGAQSAEFMAQSTEHRAGVIFHNNPLPGEPVPRSGRFGGF